MLLVPGSSPEQALTKATQPKRVKLPTTRLLRFTTRTSLGASSPKELIKHHDPTLGVLPKHRLGGQKCQARPSGLGSDRAETGEGCVESTAAGDVRDVTPTGVGAASHLPGVAEQTEPTRPWQCIRGRKSAPESTDNGGSRVDVDLARSQQQQRKPNDHDDRESRGDPRDSRTA